MTGDCAADACPFDGGFLDYEPSAVGSAIFLVAFALLVPLTFYQGYRFKTPLFASTLATGILLEVLGFAGRLRLRGHLASETSFSLLLLGTVLGPTLISAALCQVLPHIVALYGLGIGSTRPRVAGVFLVFAILLVIALEIAGVIVAVFGLGGVQVRVLLSSADSCTNADRVCSRLPSSSQAWALRQRRCCCSSVCTCGSRGRSQTQSTSPYTKHRGSRTS